MRTLLTFLTILLTLTVHSQVSQTKDTSHLVIADDTELFINYPGGNSAMYSYLQTNTIYPDSAKRNGIQGIVLVQFSIDSVGKISDIKIIKGLSADIDREVVRLISNMSDWQWDKRVKPCDRKFIKTLPIKFALE